MKWLTVDPGEETGYAVWEGSELLVADQCELWEFIDRAAKGRVDYANGEDPDGADEEFGYYGAMVVENWALYPWKLKELAWDLCRTARGIGALELICRQAHIKLVLQAAAIKETAVAAGAEELYLTPLKPNRHANDAIQHGVYYLATEGGPPC